MSVTDQTLDHIRTRLEAERTRLDGGLKSLSVRVRYDLTTGQVESVDLSADFVPWKQSKKRPLDLARKRA